MLKKKISPSTGNPVSRLCLNLGGDTVALFKAVADIKKLTVEQCFVVAMRPYVLSLVEELAMNPDADVLLLEEIEHAVSEILMNVKLRVAA